MIFIEKIADYRLARGAGTFNSKLRQKGYTAYRGNSYNSLLLGSSSSSSLSIRDFSCRFPSQFIFDPDAAEAGSVLGSLSDFFSQVYFLKTKNTVSMPLTVANSVLTCVFSGEHWSTVFLSTSHCSRRTLLCLGSHMFPYFSLSTLSPVQSISIFIKWDDNDIDLPPVRFRYRSTEVDTSHRKLRKPVSIFRAWFHVCVTNDSVIFLVSSDNRLLSG
jgi:hypothetical protein